MNPPRSARARAPASVGNIGVGFDLLGHALDGWGDEATVERVTAPGVRIRGIEGDSPGVADIPLDPQRNTAGRALLALCEYAALPFGFELTLHKGLPLGSGLGGSAASCVAALTAANALLESPLTPQRLYRFALAGEAVASGSVHGDNVAPMLLGGVTLATPQSAIRLTAPDWLHAAVVHPRQILETRRARAALADPYPLPQVVAQTTHLALFLTGLQRGDAELIGAGLHDVLVEPRRAPLIPGFAAVKAAALDHAALGASISGAGPSVFAWFASRQAAEQALEPMRQAFRDAGFDANGLVSPVNAAPARVIACAA